MVCIYCGSDTRVTNSRLQRQSNRIWRRRQCTQCSSMFTTNEAPELASAFMVAGTAPDTLEPFYRDQLFASIYESCKHRKTAITDATELTQTVITMLVAAAQDGKLQKQVITDITADVLLHFDPAASTMYRAYHG